MTPPLATDRAPALPRPDDPNRVTPRVTPRVPRPKGAPRATRGPEARAWRRHGRPSAPPTPDPAPSPPVRLLAATVPSPFAPGREVVFARANGALLEPLGVRHGDHVALERTDHAEHGDLAAVVDASGRAALWRVYPEGDGLRLSTGDPAQSRRTAPHPRVQGVVVGVLRKFTT